jgi:uncharacterized protein (TIGR00255 family)
MTGYGEIQQADGDVAYSVELRSVNNRYLKTSIKLPESLTIFEPEVEKLLRQRLSRGSVSYTLRMSDKSAEAAQQINTAALKSYVDQLQAVSAGNGALQIDLSALLALPGVVQPPELNEQELARRWQLIEKLSNQALDQLLEMRRVDGAAVREDLLSQCRAMQAHLDVIAERAPSVVAEYHERLLNRVNELLAASKLQLELDDLRREVAIYAERCDINEELSRLSSHLKQFQALCDSSELAGRKLDFLAQEMLREANTIGSKSNDKTIAHRVVDIKGGIDRLKEQVQNVE